MGAFTRLLLKPSWRWLLAANAALIILLLAHVAFAPAFRIDTTFDGATVKIQAERAWTIWPGQCAAVSWDLEGIQSLYINGAGKAGWGELDFCPSPSQSSLNFVITPAAGAARHIVVSVHNLAVYLVNWLGMLALSLPFGIAGWVLARTRLDAPLRLNLAFWLALLALLPLGALLQVAQPSLLSDLLGQLGALFTRPGWHTLGWVLAAFLFIPLAYQMLRSDRRGHIKRDLAAIGACLGVVALLFSQASFDSIGQWESWPLRAWLEGRASKADSEFVLRFWMLVPYALSASISWHSFIGFHLLSFLMFWGMLALLYGILRQLGLAAWLAFLAAILFLVYPVNSSLMSLRSLGQHFGKLALLAALYLALVCRARPSRLRLLGLWLALLLSLGSHETGFVLILVLPLLWWWRIERAQVWHRLHLTLIWYLAPAVKLAHLLLLKLAVVHYFGDWHFASPGAFTLDGVVYHLDVVAHAYLQTFVYGWQDALGALSQNDWLLATAASLALVAVAAAWLCRESEGTDLPTPRHLALMLAGGFLFILPAIGVVMWLPRRAYSLWRMYVYVPIGGAVAVLALVMLLASALNPLRRRQAAVILLCLVMIAPGLSRLYQQQAWFTASADAKAHVLMQVVEQAPWFEPHARLIIVTSMSSQDLRDRGIKELHSNMLDSAIYMLYQQGRPRMAGFCMFAENCGSSDIDISANYLAVTQDFSDAVLFQLHEDLRIELLWELPPELSDRANYDPSQLIDTSAPVPARALSMLADARQSLSAAD